MKFYDLLIVDKDDHRMDVSKHFEPGTKLVFQLVADELHYYYEAERVVENGKSLPVCAKVGQISKVDEDGMVEVPWWVLESADVVVEAMLVAPVYSEALQKVSSICLVPLDDVKKPAKKQSGSKKDKQKGDDSDSKNVAFKKHNIKNLSERMLSASFGEDFDTTAGVEANPLSDYIDDF